jgi:hypothetical protein
MQLKEGKKIEYFEYGFDFNKHEEEYLVDYAKNHIVNDIPALINYAVNDILLDCVNKLEKNPNYLNEIFSKKVAKKKVKKSKTP